MSGRELRIVVLTTEQTYPLRAAVLRRGTPSTEVRFAEDEWPGTIHLGVADSDNVIGTSTWVPRPYEAEPSVRAVQLRGMATAHGRQSGGVGALLLRAGVERMAAAGIELVWARARDAALAFYERNGFTPVGEGYVDATTQLPHHTVIHRIG